MAFFGALLSILPLAYLLDRSFPPGYGRPYLRFERWLRSRKSPLGFGALAGILVGALSAFFVDFINHAVWGFSELDFKPSNALSWSLQMSFLRAGLLEEGVKTALTFVLIYVCCRRGGPGLPRSRGRILRAAPLLSGAVGLGFAFLENIGYFAVFGAEGRMGLFFSRLFFAATAHLLLGLLFGLWIYWRDDLRLPARFVSGLFIVILAHGLYDFFAFARAPLAAFLVFFVLSLLGFAVLGLYQRLFASPRRLRKITGVSRAREESVLLDPFVQNRPAARTFPIHSLPQLDAATQAVLTCREFVGPMIPTLKTDSIAWEERLRVFGATYWDASALAGDHSQVTYESLLACGIDLLQLRPLRVASFHTAARFCYLSIGLAPYSGREIAVFMPGEFPLVRLFFLAIAAGRTRIGQRYNFQRLPAILVGDPMDWIAGYVRLPLLDDLLLMAAGDDAPDEIFFYSRPEAALIDSVGWPGFLALQKRDGIAWHNDFSRRAPVL